MVTVPMVPCPHIGRHPLVSMNNTAASFCSLCGGYKILPLIMSCPRGSNIRPLRIQSYSFKKCNLFSIILFPCRKGAPPVTTRTGLPQVCASMQKKVLDDIFQKVMGWRSDKSLKSLKSYWSD